MLAHAELEATLHPGSRSSVLRVAERARRTTKVAASTRFAAALAAGGVAFSWSYVFLHALHVANAEPYALVRLSSIPLFRACLGASVFGALTTAAAASVNPSSRFLRLLPPLLAFTVMAFTVEMLLFP